MTSKPSARAEAQNMIARLFERGEEVVGVFLEELLGNRNVAGQLGKTVGRAAGAKKRVDQNMQALLSLLNVPSRADYQRLLIKIEGLQGSMVNLNMKLDRLIALERERTATAPKAAAPRKRARQRPAKRSDARATTVAGNSPRS
jgi:hypothetical protein